MAKRRVVFKKDPNWIWFLPYRRGEFTDGEAPTLLTLKVFSDTQINLAWTDNSANEEGYSIERGLDGINFAEIGTVLADIVLYVDATCSPNTLYYYRVRAYKGGFYSDYSNVESAATLP